MDVREFFMQSNFLQTLLSLQVRHSLQSARGFLVCCLLEFFYKHTAARFFMYLSIFSFLSSTDRRPTLKLESSIADISVAARGVGLRPLPAIDTFTQQMRLLIEGQDIRCLITVMI
ncbi:hypothetical protein MUK42_20015 [Musa troglodytarum]|uniref:Uncharacterized protein n=1 Tax=Musa troglodytarum TaxID=320322 RepID=A0A9E7K7A3_9LILI|nr:hypothetical protein MUK42_20015 [Musa troglodytarum]